MRKDEFPLIDAYADSKVKEVLDRIRAEILEEHGYSKDYVGTFTYSTIKVATVLRILDKYKAAQESEDNNG